MKTQYLSLLVCVFGVFLIALPMVVSLEALPYSPYIPENYYSSGDIDYVNGETGKYYLVCMPRSEKGVSLTGASLRLRHETTDVTIPVPFKKIVESPSVDYDWYQYWYETDVYSDNLDFGVEYSITWTVYDDLGRQVQVSDTLTFIELTGPIPTGKFYFNNQEATGQTIFLNSSTLWIEFFPDNPEIVTGVAAKIYRNGALVTSITTGDYYPNFVEQSGGEWFGYYNFTTGGDYLVDCYVSNSQRMFKLSSVTVQYLHGDDDLPVFGGSSYAFYVQGMGAVIVCVGSVGAIKTRNRGHKK